MNNSSHSLNSSFTSLSQKLPEYIRQISEKDTLQSQQSQKNPITKSLKFDCQMNKIRSEFSTILETSNKLYVFLIRSAQGDYSQLIIYEYKKENGSFRSLQINGIRGKVTLIKACFAIYKKSNHSKNKKSIKLENQRLLELVVLLGTSKGYLKVIRFTKTQDLQSNSKIESIKLDYSQISFLQILKPEYYSQTNLCLVLSKTNRVYLLNFSNLRVISYFMPTIIGCDVGLSLSINNLNNYFIQTTEGGYIIFWDISQRILNLIKKSDQPQTLEQGIQNNEKFLDKQIVHSIVPISIFHSATIDGLRWIQLYGSLIILITKTGILKIISFNNESINSNQFCILLEYQIDDGHLVSDVRFFPLSEQIFIVKSLLFDDKDRMNRYTPLKGFDMKKDLRKGPQKQVKPYKQSSIKDHKMNFMPNSSIGSRLDNKSQINRCYFQRIRFNSELEIEEYTKIYLNHNVDHIESLEMTQDKGILLLRSMDNYVIGETKIFVDDM